MMPVFSTCRGGSRIMEGGHKAIECAISNAHAAARGAWGHAPRKFEF